MAPEANKLPRLINCMAQVLRGSAAYVLDRTLPPHFTAEQCKEIGEKIVRVFAADLPRDYESTKIVHEQDIRDQRGQLNARVILDAVLEMAAQASKENHRHQLNYLAQHLQKTFTDLKLLKGEDHARRPEETPL